MSELDFHVDINIEVPDIKADLLMESEQRLRVLTENRNDFIGASISVEDIAGVEDRFLYQARIVAYLKPKNIAVVEKSESAETALKDALSNIEERIRTQRDKRREIWQQPGKRVHLSTQALTAREIYDTYVDDVIPQGVLDQGRDQIAALLMLNGKLDQESAYYAADRILEYNQQIASGK